MKWTRCPKEHLALLFFVFIRFLPLFVIYLRLFSAPFRFRVCRFFITAGALDHFPNDVLIAQHRIFFSTRPFTLFRYRFFFSFAFESLSFCFRLAINYNLFFKNLFIHMMILIYQYEFEVGALEDHSFSVSRNLCLSQ